MKTEDPIRPTVSNVDAQNRHLAQQAGLDQDLESQVPARYGSFTVTTLGVMLVVLLAITVWMVF